MTTTSPINLPASIHRFQKTQPIEPIAPTDSLLHSSNSHFYFHCTLFSILCYIFYFFTWSRVIDRSSRSTPSKAPVLLILSYSHHSIRVRSRPDVLPSVAASFKDLRTVNNRPSPVNNKHSSIGRRRETISSTGRPITLSIGRPITSSSSTWYASSLVLLQSLISNTRISSSRYHQTCCLKSRPHLHGPVVSRDLS